VIPTVALEVNGTMLINRLVTTNLDNVLKGLKVEDLVVNEFEIKNNRYVSFNAGVDSINSLIVDHDINLSLISLNGVLFVTDLSGHSLIISSLNVDQLTADSFLSSSAKFERLYLGPVIDSGVFSTPLLDIDTLIGTQDITLNNGSFVSGIGRVSSLGNVTFGDTELTNKLTVLFSDNTLFDAGDTSTWHALRVSNVTDNLSSDASLLFGDGSVPLGLSAIRTSTGSALAIYNEKEVFRILGSGGVGIGTTNFSTALAVEGNSSFSSDMTVSNSIQLQSINHDQ
jgi:hypothetical protein